ncbi:hypothetical protein B296_00003155 [Ensete ventricosum]|uniref:Uncharacterized protein n=1 Tax=Ensete ventricosum TaxID=4639 RepID=A0A427AWN4_ENSVE|nr:hypothetical protein B296_00003155 [Ensete ventricosum]
MAVSLCGNSKAVDIVTLEYSSFVPNSGCYSPKDPAVHIMHVTLGQASCLVFRARKALLVSAWGVRGNPLGGQVLAGVVGDHI